MTPDDDVTAEGREALVRLGGSVLLALAAIVLGRYFAPLWFAFVALPILGAALWLAATGGYAAGWDDLSRRLRGRR